MASIFSYGLDIPRVSSPWTKVLGEVGRAPGSRDHDQAAVLSEHVKLDAEPQIGPVEYKLHLLLRSRRNYECLDRAVASTLDHSRFAGTGTTILPATPLNLSPVSLQIRQHRLEQLTTQLLWRLQQSSPHHASSAANSILPTLPDGLGASPFPAPSLKPLPGLAESQGALYEIGIADDGTFVGLAEDELQESLHNLRIMAACLGCVVNVTRLILVGAGEWLDQVYPDADARPVRRRGDLLVAEALVRPSLSTPSTSKPNPVKVSDSLPFSNSSTSMPATSFASQLRVSLTGSTLSGKSSLLGTLSTSTLDDARGKSRLTMLKHRHEITSGVTSSIAQEIIGYRNKEAGDISVINYAADDVTSWSDIHRASDNGRIVFVSDSAGHPRYRRTTVKGLVGWAPHWVILCVSSNDRDSIPSSPVTAACDRDLVADNASHDTTLEILQLCIRLELPMVIVITKLDTTSKSGLRFILAPLLSVLKDAQRRPAIIPDHAGTVSQKDMDSTSCAELEEIRNIVGPVTADCFLTVPIIMTSAVQGTGIRRLHALLHELPVPRMTTSVSHDDAKSTIRFNVEDVYAKTDESVYAVLAGHLQRGVLNMSDELYLGPCTVSSEDSDSDSPSAERTPHATPPVSPQQVSPWLSVRLSSLRDRRLPVDKLLDDQVGTIGVELLDPAARPRLRKGMVLLSAPAKASSGFCAEFDRRHVGGLAVGSQVTVYVASVRASARISSVSGASDETLNDRDSRVDDCIHVALSFESTREYVEVGSRVLVMPSGGPLSHTAKSSAGVALFSGNGQREKRLAGLEGYVGRIVDAG